MPLICLLILLAALNAVASEMEWRWMKWTVTVYWLTVGVYWMLKGVGR